MINQLHRLCKIITFGQTYKYYNIFNLLIFSFMQYFSSLELISLFLILIQWFYSSAPFSLHPCSRTSLYHRSPVSQRWSTAFSVVEAIDNCFRYWRTGSKHCYPRLPFGVKGMSDQLFIFSFGARNDSISRSTYVLSYWMV